MSYQLPPRVRELAPYAPVEGSFPVRLDANESYLSLPMELRKELAEAVQSLDYHRYPDPRAATLCQAFAQHYGLPSGACVVAGNGSDELIGLLASSFVRPGSPMAVVQPDFSMYGFYAQLAGVPLVVFEKGTDGLSLDVAGLVRFCKEQRPSLLILSNPCNPTSLVAGREELLALVQALPDCLVVVDEAYMDFASGSVLDAVQDYDNLLVLRTCSKALGLAAIRLGFAVGSPALVQGLLAVKSPYNVNAMTQVVGERLFAHPDYLHSCTQKLIHARDSLYHGLVALGGRARWLLSIQNTQANFVFVRVRQGEEIWLQAAREGIALRRMGEYLRITAGSPQENQMVLAFFERLCKEDWL